MFQSPLFGQAMPSTRLADFMYWVYGWMAAALLATALSAIYVASKPELYTALFGNPTFIILLIIMQLVLVVVLSIFLMRMSFPLALTMFMVYAFSLGIMLSSIFLLYEKTSIYSTFLVTAGMFGVMAIYGYYTRTDLTTIGNLSIMVLVGLIIGLVINMFLGSQTFDFILSGVGVVVFTLLTAFDVQKIKRIGQQLLSDQDTLHKVALFGALTLYLDFINLFLFLLRFTGRPRK